MIPVEVPLGLMVVGGVIIAASGIFWLFDRIGHPHGVDAETTES